MALEIRRRRLGLGLSLSEAARQIGISRQALLAIEQGRVPRADTALKIARTLHTTVEALWAPERPYRWVGQPSIRARWALVRQLTLFRAQSLAADVSVQGTVVTPLPEARPPERVVVIAGCDPALPMMADWMQRLHPGWWCEVWPCPSMEALELYRDGLVHVAGIHLYHGMGYNEPWTRDLSGSAGVHSVTWEAGLVARDSHDLAVWPRHWREGRMAVRQPGSEARALADRMAARQGLDQAAWSGRPAGSHLEAGLWVSEGTARVAVSTRAVAALFGLEFERWAEEPFDWVIDRSPQEGVERLLQTLTHPLVRASLAELPGYRVEGSGQPLWSHGS
jgi:molybdate-binding protein/DNA-binding XRE family transcriptional regulator